LHQSAEKVVTRKRGYLVNDKIIDLLEKGDLQEAVNLISGLTNIERLALRMRLEGIKKLKMPGNLYFNAQTKEWI
jgi:hypothetical protein